MRDQTKLDLWFSIESSLHINQLEMTTVILTLKHFLPTRECVLIMLDNTTVVSYTRRQRGNHSMSLFDKMVELFQWATNNQISLRVSFIMGQLNMDMLSRQRQIIKTEWPLSGQVFQNNHLISPSWSIRDFSKKQTSTICHPVPGQEVMGNRYSIIHMD